MAAAHRELEPDPCAKNFKLPFKVVAVVDGTLPQEEVNDACEMVEETARLVAEAPPPIYAEQGQPRGRKPKKGSKLNKVKKHVKKSKKSKGKGKKTPVSSTGDMKKSMGKKSPAVASTVHDGNDDDNMEVRDNMEVPPVASKTKNKVLKKKKKGTETGASAPAACPKPKAARRKRNTSKAVSAHPSAAPNGPSVEVDCTKDDAPAAGDAEPTVKQGAGLDLGDRGPDESEKPVRPDDAIEAPSHLTLNAIYSSAYRKAKAATGTSEAARAVAQCQEYIRSIVMFFWGPIFPSLY